MGGTRCLKAVLHNFLEAFRSRYTDFDGYWLFGYVNERLDALDIDLLARDAELDSPDLLTMLIAHARAVFRDQARKQRLAPERLASARLTIHRTPGPSVRVFASAGCVDGHEYRFVAEAVTKTGHREVRVAKSMIGPLDETVMSRSSQRGPPRVHRT